MSKPLSHWQLCFHWFSLAGKYYATAQTIRAVNDMTVRHNAWHMDAHTCRRTIQKHNASGRIYGHAEDQYILGEGVA